MLRLACLLFALSTVAASAADVSLADCTDGDSDAALAACTRIIEQADRPAEERAAAYASRSWHYEGRNLYEEALADVNESIRLDPRPAFVYDNRSNAERILGKTDEALADANEALKHDPDDLPAHLNRGLVYYERGNYDGAIADFTVFITRGPPAAEAFTFRGMSYGSNKQFDLALADINAAIMMKTDGTRPYLVRAGIYLEQQKYDLAIADYSEILNLKPNNARALYGRSLAKTRSGASGQDDLDRANALDPDIATEFAKPGYF